MENRRQFTRILFELDASLVIGGELFPVTLHDISLNGALVALTTATPIPNEDGQLTIVLSDNENRIVMDVTVVHQTANEVGLKCHHIDIESISHLKRLVALNLGDDEQLHRELSQLTS